jgi:neutral ceramidase
MWRMLLLALLVGCPGPEDREFDWPQLVAGSPVAGVAEASLRLPLGTPLAGYSSRCTYLGGNSKQDKRDSVFSVGFVESTGLQTRPKLKGLWLENGDDNLLILKADIIYSFDGMVSALTERLEAQTGEKLDGRVVFATNHSHASYGPFSDAIHFYLGGDRYNEEIFQSFLSQLEAVALEAYDTREPVRIGNGWAKDWDPDDQVYRDRRGENNELVVWEDVEPGYGKDPYLHMLRIDTLDGAPLGMAFTFGIHGTSLDGDSSMVSSDAPGHVEWAVQEAMGPGVMVMHLQGAGGDVSPAGRDENYARLESVGEAAIAPILDLWARTPTSSEPIFLESASRHHDQGLEVIRVTRNDTVNWYYNPYKEGYLADDIIYGPDGEILSPLDEFNAPNGAAFCGSDTPLIPAGNIGSEVFPYSACMDVELVSYILNGIFGLDEIPLPMPSSLKAGSTVSRIGPLVTLTVDGEIVERDLLVGFFPGETTGMFAEQWRRRVEAELGYEMPLLVGYAQDHEGYLLLPEDWLAGGYEPNINVWGPLQAEYLMEQTLQMAAVVLGTSVREPADPDGRFAPSVYPFTPLLEEQPDLTPDAGTPLVEAPEYLWTPLNMPLDLSEPVQLDRVQGVVQFAWEGGDPVVDQPRIVLEREEDGLWREVLSPSGRPVTEEGPEILLAHTPDPLYPSHAEQVHRYWASWQAVGSVGERTALPLGNYRFGVSGKRYVGGSTSWPWATQSYSFSTASFALEAAPIRIEAGEGGFALSLDAPSVGWRMVDRDGSSRGENPVNGLLELVWAHPDGDFLVEQTAVLEGQHSWLAIEVPTGATALLVRDAYGNEGVLEL